MSLENTMNTIGHYAKNVWNTVKKQLLYGTYNTNPSEETIITPLGNTLYPVIYANTTTGNGNYVAFVHETKRALGFKGVGWYSVMRVDAPAYTQEDKDISVDLSRPYWNAVYQDEKTYIPMEYLSESMPFRNRNKKQNH